MTDSPPDEAVVVAAHGTRGLIETATGEQIPFLAKGRLTPVCGDRVCWTRDGERAIVTSIGPRSNKLERRAPRRQLAEVIAANLQHVLVVLAPRPQPDWYLLDHYLCAAAVMDCAATLIVNKSDLGETLADEARVYSDLGYELLRTSAIRRHGLQTLDDRVGRQTGIMVGQSGVGKSSLINSLVPDADAAVGALSAATREGRHTTTATVMHTLPGGGRLIDTPGVREFLPLIRDQWAVQSGFAEIGDASRGCRFTDCRHLREPDCEVKRRRDAGQIDARRYESYRRLLRNALAEA